MKNGSGMAKRGADALRNWEENESERHVEWKQLKVEADKIKYQY